jgi:hypothetical protein
MGSWREHQTGVGKQDRRTTANDNHGQSDPTETLKGYAPAHDVWHQKQTSDAKAKRRDVPGREARSEAKACDDDPSGPDADRGEAIQRAAHIPDSGLAIDHCVAHGLLLEQG